MGEDRFIGQEWFLNLHIARPRVYASFTVSQSLPPMNATEIAAAKIITSGTVVFEVILAQILVAGVIVADMVSLFGWFSARPLISHGRAIENAYCTCAYHIPSRGNFQCFRSPFFPLA
jgi:hypothetical protein